MFAHRYLQKLVYKIAECFADVRDPSAFSSRLLVCVVNHPNVTVLDILFFVQLNFRVEQWVCEVIKTGQDGANAASDARLTERQFVERVQRILPALCKSFDSAVSVLLCFYRGEDDTFRSPVFLTD